MKNYITPDMEITEFEAEDVITTSDYSNSGDPYNEEQGGNGNF